MPPSERALNNAGLGGTRSAALAANHKIDPPTKGIHCNAAGTVTGKLIDDDADGDYVLAAGAQYGLHFKSITSIGTATGRMLW